MIMKKALRFILASALILSCSTSCVIQRLFSPEKRKSDITPAEIHQIIPYKGILEAPYYETSVEGPSKRRMMVYLPADYYNTDKTYPVVYLLHGARGNETSWIDQGMMTEVVDELWRKQLLEPCIIVLPNTNSYQTDEDGLTSRYKSVVQAMFDIDGSVEASFISDVVGYIDKHYRTIPDKSHRAIAGLSIGSLQTAFITADQPDCFDYIGLFSPILKAPLADGPYSVFYDRHSRSHLRAVQFSPAHSPKVYVMMIGRFDVYFNHAEQTHMDMVRRGYQHDFITSGGGHGWSNWTHYLEYFLCLCFK